MFLVPEKQVKGKFYIYMYLSVKIRDLGFRCHCRLGDIS